MARILQEELDRIKRELSVEALARARGIDLKAHGANLIGLCPFQDDHAPSLVITPSKNLWHCLGACQQGGSVIDFVMKAEGVSFRHAVELLRADLPLAACSSGHRVVKASTVTKLPPPVVPDAANCSSKWSGTTTPPRHAAAEPRSVAVPGTSRAPLGGDDRALPARLCQPHACLPAAGARAHRTARAA